MAKTVIPWFGGKHRLAPKIAKLIPKDHIVYCEAFGGAASVLFAKERSKLEVYNDVNEGLYSLFTVLKDPAHFAKFYGQLQLTTYSRQEFDKALERWKCSTDMVERALSFYVLARQSFASGCKTWGYDKQPGSRGSKSAGSYLNALNELPKIHERIDAVTIDNNDWRKVLEAYDTPETIFYLDPPYVPDTRKSGDYHHELNLDDHKDLVKMLLKLEGRAMLSGYGSEVYKPLEDAGWMRLEIEAHCSAAGHTRQKKMSGKEYNEATRRIECLWLHPGIEVDSELIKDLGFRVAETGNE